MRASGEVADVRDTGEGEQVVLAERVKGDVADDDELVVALVVGKRGELEGLRRQELGIGTCHPPWRVRQVFVAGIASEGDEEIPDGVLSCGQVDPGRPVDGVEVGDRLGEGHAVWS